MPLDQGSAVAEAHGVAVEVPERARPLYARLGHDVPRMNGDGSWRVSLPSTFVVDRTGRIVLAHADLVPERRLEPEAAIAAARALPG